jgi:hypothetical protein
MKLQQVSENCFGVLDEKTRSYLANLPDSERAAKEVFARFGADFAEPAGRLLPSRWPVRQQMQKYHA